MSKLWYLASPYSAYHRGREEAYYEVCEMAARLMLDGFSIFCPIAHSHSIETTSMEGRQEGDWWLDQDFAVLSKCDGLIVYMMPGWEKSYGVGKEIEFAKERGIPIVYLDFEENNNNEQNGLTAEAAGH